MKVCVILAGKTDFSVERASAVDLYVHHYALASRFRSDTIIVGDARGRQLPNVEFVNLNGALKLARLRALMSIIAGYRPSILVVHQNVTIAAALRRLFDRMPLVFVQHALVDTGNNVRSYFLRRKYERFAQVVCASESARERLQKTMPDLAQRISVVPSGLNMREWTPASVRRTEILLVGRCIPQKGIHEAAIAIRDALAKLKHWRAEFILSLPARRNSYVDDVLAVITAIGPRAGLRTNVPFDVVKQANEHAAIAIMPSFYPENFARTALEAHAGGAALISSGCGALREVSGNFAFYADPKNMTELTQAIERLALDEPERHRLARLGARRARELFDIRHTGAKLDDLLEKLSSDASSVCTISGNTSLAYFKSRYLLEPF